MKFQDELNSKIWENNELKLEVADKLDEIASAFVEYLNIPLDSIEDIRITGSSANYNYTPQSDLDLHLIVDYEKVHEDCPIVEGYLWSMKSAFNKDHDISIYGIPVELYAEDSRLPATSNGVYSLVNREWIKFPEKIEPTDNDAAVQAKYRELKDASERIDDSEVAEELLDKIYAMRKAGLADGGEFSTENMAFKLLRNDGVIDKLKQLKKERVDKELTLEVANEVITINSTDIKEPIRDFYKNNIQGKTIIHPTLGKILFTGIGLGETRNKVRGKYLDILSKIDTIVLTGNSDGIMEELTHPRNDNIIGFYLITNEVILNGKHLAVKVRIAVDNDGNKYYVFKTKSIKETIDSEPQLQSLKRPLRGKINSSTSIITENYNNFNTADIILGDSIYIDILNELNESNNGHICLKLARGKNNYGFAGIRNNELYTDYSSNDCTQFKSFEDAKPIIDRYRKAGFTVTLLGTGKFSYLNNASKYKFESLPEVSSMCLLTEKLKRLIELE